MKKIKVALFFVFLFVALPVSARDYVYDWYIKDFQTEIVVQEDSSLVITERIVADCGDLPNKHGIFRVLPKETKTFDGRFLKNHIELLSITDFSGRDHKYEEIESNFYTTITWKIGDPNRTVNGENDYKIVYKVENAVYKDIFHWNLVGNFWDIEIDNFTAKIIFPEEITENNAYFEYYTGYLGEENKDASYQWIEDNILQVTSTSPLKVGQGITIKAYLPEGFFPSYEFGFFELYLKYFYLLIPVFVFAVCLFLWIKYGKDHRVKKPVVTEFLRPEDIDLLEAGLFMNNGRMDSRFVTALIIDMAVKKAIIIEEKKEKASLLPFTFTEIFIKKIERKEDLTETEKDVFDEIFSKGDVVNLKSIEHTFPLAIKEIAKSAQERLVKKKLFYKKGFDLQKKLGVAFFVFLFTSFFLLTIFVVTNIFLILAMFISSVILFFFSFIMPKRTKEGVELYYYLKGLKRYMTFSEKERQQFYEEENMFEKLLPYAILFNITKQWTRKMETIYGKEYFKNYSPAWMIVSGGGYSNLDSFTKSLDSVSRKISSSHSSGSGGSGGSGGGGGGGGGGGW